MRALALAATFTIAWGALRISSQTLPLNNDGYGGKLSDAAFKRHIEQQVTRQAAGKRPPFHDNSTWKVYWTAWYDGIRISSGLPWKSTEFRSKDDMIAYIKRRLRAHGLPMYE
jgi:hypothetical protein